jgi:hypothetical protein
MTGTTVVAVVFVDVGVTFFTGFATLAVLVADFLTGFLVCPEADTVSRKQNINRIQLLLLFIVLVFLLLLITIHHKAK